MLVMGWLARSGMFAGGLFMVLLAKAQLSRGHVVFPNASYHQTTFAASGFGIGLVLMLLAFLPPSDWVYRYITTKRSIRLKTFRRRRIRRE